MKDFKDILSPSGAEVSIIPVVQADMTGKVNLADLPDTLPILALRNAVLFPGTVYPITIGREMSIRLIRDAEEKDLYIGAVPQTDITVENPVEDDLFKFGTVAKVIKTMEMPDGTLTAIIQGFRRFDLLGISEYEPYMRGRVNYRNDVVPDADNSVKMITKLPAII